MQKRVLDDRLIFEILSAIGEIPPGRVATYGQIARLVGRDGGARLVGKVCSLSQLYGSFPCHRVVDHTGRLVPGWAGQGALLEREGVPFKDESHVDLRRCRWEC